MDIRQLRYFIAVVEAGSFSGAAARLRISQPSVGQQVKNLEEELGSALLQRHSRGVSVTPIGTEFAELARDIVARAEAAVRSVQDQAAQPFGQVRIGMTVSAAAPLAAAMVRATAERFPKIEFLITESLSHYLLDMLMSDDLDLSLAYIGDFPEGLRGETLAQEDFHLCVPAGHALADRETIAMREVLAHPLLLPPESHMLHAQVHAVALELGQTVRILHIVHSVGVITNFIELGIGISILPLAAVTGHVAAGTIRPIPIVAPALTRTMTLVYSGRRPMTRAEIAVSGIVKALVGEEIASGRLRWRRPARADGAREPAAAAGDAPFRGRDSRRA